MGCCLSKKPPPSNGNSCAVKAPDVSKSNVEKPTEVQETKPIPEDATKKEVLVVEHRRSHENSKKSDSEESNSKAVVRTSSCTKEEVDAILIQCGKMSRSNSAAKTRKRSFDFDQNENVEERRTPRRVNGSPRERRRRTPSREREDSKSYRSGSRERGNGGGSRRVSRSPAKRSETHSNISRPGKFVTVPATDKSYNGGDQSIKRITVKRNIDEACKTASNVQPPSSLTRRADQSPYRRNPLGEIDQNSSKGVSNKRMMKRDAESANQRPQVISRSRSLRKSRDFDFSPQTLLQDNNKNNNDGNYTALLLRDIQNFHGKSNPDDDSSPSLSVLPSCVTKACSIVEAVEDLNSNQFRFTSTANNADLMEPSFEKYVTVKRGGGSLEEQESSGSNNLLT